MKHFVFALVAFLTAVSASAQLADSSAIRSAWFIQAGAGVGAHDNGPFSRRLQSYTPRATNGERMVYQTEAFSQVGYSVGGALGIMLDGGVVLGASGESLLLPTVSAITGAGSERDEYDLSGWEAGVDIGYVLLNQDYTIVYPYLHAGYASYTLEYGNNQEQAIPFFEGEPVPAGTTATYTGAAPRIGLGVGLTSFVGGDIGGFVIGARLLYGTMLGRPEWEQDGETVNNGGHTPCYNAVTLSLAIGFGGGE